MTTEREARGELMMRKKRRTNGGPLRGSKMFLVPVSLTKDQDLCDTSLLNLQRQSLCLCLYL